MSGSPASGTAGVRIITIGDRGDTRGLFFFAPRDAVDFLGDIKDVRAGTSKPGVVRGNNFNIVNRQAVIVIHESEWTLFWDSGEGTSPCHLSFQGTGAELVLVNPGCARAIQNTGDMDIVLVELSDAPYRADDVRRRVLCEPD